MIFSKYGRIIRRRAARDSSSGATDQRSNVYDLSRLTITGWTLIFKRLNTRKASESYERETGWLFSLSGLMTFDVPFFVPFAKREKKMIVKT